MARSTTRTLLLVAAWGATTTVVAYLISGGNLVLFVIAMFAIGIVQRVVAVRVTRQGGGQPPRWWQV